MCTRNRFRLMRLSTPANSIGILRSPSPQDVRLTRTIHSNAKIQHIGRKISLQTVP